MTLLKTEPLSNHLGTWNKEDETKSCIFLSGIAVLNFLYQITGNYYQHFYEPIK